MPKLMYMDQEKEPLRVGDYIKVIGGTVLGQVTSFHVLPRGSAVVSVSWDKGQGAHAWLTEIVKAEPEELI